MLRKQLSCLMNKYVHFITFNWMNWKINRMCAHTSPRHLFFPHFTPFARSRSRAEPEKKKCAPCVCAAAFGVPFISPVADGAFNSLSPICISARVLPYLQHLGRVKSVPRLFAFCLAFNSASLFESFPFYRRASCFVSLLNALWSFSLCPLTGAPVRPLSIDRAHAVTILNYFAI